MTIILCIILQIFLISISIICFLVGLTAVWLDKNNKSTLIKVIYTLIDALLFILVVMLTINGKGIF